MYISCLSLLEHKIKEFINHLGVRGHFEAVNEQQFHILTSPTCCIFQVENEKCL